MWFLGRCIIWIVSSMLGGGSIYLWHLVGGIYNSMQLMYPYGWKSLLVLQGWTSSCVWRHLCASDAFVSCRESCWFSQVSFFYFKIAPLFEGVWDLSLCRPMYFRLPCCLVCIKFLFTSTPILLNMRYSIIRVSLFFQTEHNSIYPVGLNGKCRGSNGFSFKLWQNCGNYGETIP